MQCGERGIAVACLQETHLKQDDIAPRIQVYIAATRQDHKDGYGGTIIYVRDGLKGKVVSCETCSPQRVQMCSMTIRIPRGILPIANTYAAPGWTQNDLKWM